ncbi:hypothetical protein QJS04_geneDACA002978 [Acorus gramineus]|uniref:Small ribosomal subunit protein mS35 mitochondrial conserved domain-containing protein n=1 Tax=Acorus gramineus TaxID=55184 RepID=A0AAV9BTS0_ACOGR|nr:hypothetical protein QJS04_geneDACA002978 [Acorus gramineus]
MKRAISTSLSLSTLRRRHLLPPPPPLFLLQKLRLFSSDDQTPPSEPTTAEADAPEVEDVGNEEFKRRIERYFRGDESALPSILEAVMARHRSGKHEETDDELMEELRMKPIEGVRDSEFEEDFEKMHETDEEIDNLYNARDYVVKKMMREDEYWVFDQKKWDQYIEEEKIELGYVKEIAERDTALEKMLSWDKIVPDDVKKKIAANTEELEERVKRGELQTAEAFELHKAYEEEVIREYAKAMGEEQTPEEDAIAKSLDDVNNLEDPPGEGPILTWTQRAVFSPGGDSWHPKNRLVKLRVTVKELGLSKHANRRLRALVGKRYHSGKDELTITSERFEHREENRKDCLRTLLALIEEAGKADRLVEEARTSYVKERLRANAQFMQRLRAKTAAMQASPAVAPS